MLSTCPPEKFESGLSTVCELLSSTKRTGPGGAKVDIAVERTNRMEARNISEEETAAALAAPAVPKRVSKPTPKMAALAAAADARPKRAIKLPKKLSD